MFLPVALKNSFLTEKNKDTNRQPVASGGGAVVSAEQPWGSVMKFLAIFQRLLNHGFVGRKIASCRFGSPMLKMFWWLTNNPLVAELEGGCAIWARGGPRGTRPDAPLTTSRPPRATQASRFDAADQP